MATATCQSCGREFEREPDETWKRLCWTCWRARKDQELGDTRYRDGFAAGLAEGLRRNEARGPPGGGVDRDLQEHLTSLLQLCHPDRHGNSESATRATQWLLELRKRYRATG